MQWDAHGQTTLSYRTTWRKEREQRQHPGLLLIPLPNGKALFYPPEVLVSSCCLPSSGPCWERHVHQYYMNSAGDQICNDTFGFPDMILQTHNASAGRTLPEHQNQTQKAANRRQHSCPAWPVLRGLSHKVAMLFAPIYILEYL